MESDPFDGPVALFAVRELDTTRSYFEQAATDDGSATTVSAVPSGSDIGSEGHVASVLTGISRAKSGKFLNHPTVDEMRKRRCRGIFVIDDLIGSGTRTRRFLDAMWIDRSIRSWWSLGYISFHVVVFSTTQFGRYHVARARCRPAISSNYDCPTYATLPWPLDKRKSIEDICERYASQTRRPRMAFGYRDTMASIVFEHSCPNNVPAIFWASAGSGRTWTPLFRNRSVQEAEASVFPPEFVRRDPISVLIDAGQKRLAQTGLKRIGHVRSKQMLVLLALIAKGLRRNEALTFATGLSNTELEKTLLKFMTWGLITPTRRITEAGLNELEHARKMIGAETVVAQLTGETYYPKKLRETAGG